MRLKSSSLLPVMMVSALCLAASTAPVAIRVEVAPLGVSGAGTEVAVMIQVSPEDRARIGANAMVRIELDGEAPPGQSPLWAVRVKSDGGARVTTVWPPGEYHLKVEIASPSGQDTGLWVGTVRIPSFGDDGAVSEPPVIPTPVPEPDHETVAATASGAAVVAAPAVDAATPPHPPSPAAEELQEIAEHRPEPASAPEQPVVATAAVAGAAIAASEPAPEPQPEVVAVEKEAKTPEPEPPSESETTATEEAVPPPVAEPLRASESAPVVEPLRSGAAPVAAAAKAVPAPVPDDVAANIEAWADAGPQTTDMTAVVSRDREPVSGLIPAALRLQVGKDEVPIVAIGDAGNSPLYLGVAVDLSPEQVYQIPAIGCALAPLAERTRGGRGRVFVATDSDQSGWDVDPGKISEALESPVGGDLATLVISSLARFEGQRGRTFLILVTDGRFDTSKAAWGDAAAAVDRAGIPILVLALWDDRFPQRARKNLQQITAASGGRLFLVQAGDQLGGGVERFGRIIDAGVALRFQRPPGMKSPTSVSLKADDRTVEVTAPKMIR